ncbi:hypothetical protein LguiB_027837 [Lonicera macranthoides]
MGGKYFVLQSTWNEKFLEYAHGHGNDQVHGLNKFSGLIPSQYCIYQMERAKTGGLLGRVHIKCCYNNKYLVPQSHYPFLITSTADKPEEDMRKWSCTLFEIIPNLCGNTIRLRHVQLKHYACHNRYACHKSCDYYLQVGSGEPNDDNCYNFRIYGGDILKDGTYTGINACNFKCETEEEKRIAAGDLIEQLAQ